MAKLSKIINDPIYGFITIDKPVILQLLDHPWYQRLRRIYQMALAHLVYPGAVHTRLHHSLGAYHLINQAIIVLKQKGNVISQEEETAAQLAILLHDIGHCPFSHALEHVLLPGRDHENIGLAIMSRLNEDLNGALELAIKIFKNEYHKPFLHQLISGQLDVDRMDYLTRDSFYTGVSEGVIGYDRILKMLTVHENRLMVEQKGVHSIEKFLIARRLMYGQVYLHKTVLAAEKMLVKIVERARSIGATANTASLNRLLHLQCNEQTLLSDFCNVDDIDLLASIKDWSQHSDSILSMLSLGILNRKLYKCDLYTSTVPEDLITKYKKEILSYSPFTEECLPYLIVSGYVNVTTYFTEDEHIRILFKDGEVKDISEVDNALIHKALSAPVERFYICRYVPNQFL
jgi:hypothetical protein